MAIAVAGCGGGGSSIATNFIALTMTMSPSGGFTGNSTPMTSGQVAVNRTSTNQTVTIASGGRGIRYTIPSLSLMEGQTFESGVGGALLEYVEDPDLTRHHGGIHTWTASGPFTVARGPGGAVLINRNNSFTASPGDIIVISNSNAGDPIIELEPTPVGENGSIQMVNESGFSGTGSDWVGVASFQRDPTGLESIIYTETGGGTRVLYLVLDQGNAYVPQNVNPYGKLILVETIGGVDHRWIGSGGSVVPTITSFPTGQYSINGVTMNPDPMTPATGTVQINGVVIHL